MLITTSIILFLALLLAPLLQSDFNPIPQTVGGSVQLGGYEPNPVTERIGEFCNNLVVGL